MIKAGIAGLGWWGKTLVEGVAGSNDIQFVAGSARNHTDDIKAFAKQHNFTLYKTYEEMLKHAGLDAVVLATPHSLHVPQTIAAAKAGKHVFCEKPLADGLEGVDALLDLVERRGRFLMMGMCYRFHAGLRRLQQRLAGGTVGRLLTAHAFRHLGLKPPAEDSTLF